MRALADKGGVVPETLLVKLTQVIGKNGQTTFQASFWVGHCEVRPRPGEPNELDLWFVWSDAPPAESLPPYVQIPHLHQNE